MALQVKKAESFGDLIVGPSKGGLNLTVGPARNNQKLTVSRAPQHGNLSVAQHPSSNWNISGVTGAKPNPLAVVAQRTNPMNNPLKWFGETAVEFASGVADMLNPVSTFTGLSQGIAETMSWNSKASKEAREAQNRLQEQNIELIKKAGQKIRDPSTSEAERKRWQNFIRSQAHLMGTNQFEEATVPNDQIIEATDPVMGAANTVGVGLMGLEGKAIASAAQDIYAAISKSDVKKEALDYLVRQATVGRTDIPVTTQGGGDVPIPVRVNKSIPIRHEASDDVLDGRLTKEYDILYNRYSEAVKEADQYPVGVKEPILEHLDAVFQKQKDELFATRDAGIIPQRIDVKDAPVVKTPKVAKAKAEKAPKTPKAEKVEAEPIEAQRYGKSPGMLERSVRSVAGVLEKNGTGGRMINQGVQKARDFSEKATGSLMTDLKKAGFNKIGDEEFARVWDAVETGSAKGLSVDERRMAAALVRAMNKIHKVAKNDAKMDIGDRGSTYLPRWYKENDKDMVQFWKKEFNQKNSNLERKRETDEQGYEKTKESIARYIQNATDRIGKAKYFGQNDEKLAQMYDVAAREGYDIKQLQRYAKTALGDVDYNSTGQKISAGIRQYEAITSLQKSAAANIGQQVNTITVAGVKNWAKATYKYWSDPNARDWAERTGVFGDHVLGNLQKQYAGTMGDNLTGNKAVRIFKKHFLVPGMQAVEKFNRANAVLAGKGFAEDLVKKAAKGDRKSQRLLKEYFPGLRPDQPITNDMIMDASRELVKRTQFKVDPVDLPNWTSSALGKLIFQFRSFGYKQTQFMAREVIGEALQGNFGPMTRFLAIGTPVGYGIYEARNGISGMFLDEEKRKEFAEKPWFQRAFEGFSQVGGLGLPGSEATNIARSVSYADDENKVLDAATSTLGPAITDARRAADALNDGVVKGEWKNGAIFAAQQVPILGPVVSGLVKNAMKGETDINKMNADELDKFKKQTYAKFAGGMSDKDKDLLDAVNDDDYARLGIKNGKFTQDQVDDMQARYNREMFKAGLPIKYIKGVTDEEFETFSDEMKGLVMEASMVGIKKFAESEKYDPTAEAVIKKAMEQSWPEVGEIKGNNQLALDYLKAQRDYVEAEGDDGKKFDIVKAFWNKAVKQQYSEKVRNLYSNSLADIKRLYEGITVNGVKYEISRADMDAAVALDDRLLAAGLRDTPKFSNKTRAAYGYGEAGVSKVDGVGYTGKKTSSGSGGGRRRSGGSGGGSGGSEGNPYRYAVSRGSRSSLRGASGASARGGKASVKLAGATGGGTAAKPKVSRTKNKV